MTTKRERFCTLTVAAAFALGYYLQPASLPAADDKPAPVEKPAPAEKPAEAPAEIAATDKDALTAAVGKQVAVTGTITKAEWSKSGKVMNIELTDSPLMLVVFDRTKDQVNQAFDGDAAKTWTGAKVKITGKLAKYGGKAKEYEGRPQIIINDPKQLTIVEPRK
jgi:DNA/RNA endonuclease YhcR with UshA esterase domain